MKGGREVAGGKKKYFLLSSSTAAVRRCGRLSPFIQFLVILPDS